MYNLYIKKNLYEYYNNYNNRNYIILRYSNNRRNLILKDFYRYKWTFYDNFFLTLTLSPFSNYNER